MLYIRLQCLVLIAFLLSACGFHVAQPLQLPQQRWFIASNEPYSPFIQQLRQTLLSLGNQISTSPKAKDTFILEILHQDLHKQLIAVGATSQVSQYLFSYNVTYQVKTIQGRVIVNPTNVSIERFNTINSNQILSDLYNLNQMQFDLYHDAIVKIITRLNSPLAQQSLQHAYTH